MHNRFILSFLWIALIGTLLCGCGSTATINVGFQRHTYGIMPSPFPSQQVFTARPEELNVGSHPFANLTLQTVRSIRMTISREQLPQMSDPCKELNSESLLRPIVEWLSSVKIESTQAQPNTKYTPAPGGGSLTVTIALTDGSTAEYTISGSTLHAGYSYGISSAGDLVTIYESLPTPQWYAQEDGTLLSDSPDRAQFYVRRAQDGITGELIAQNGENKSALYPWVCLSPFVLGDANSRVVFAGYSGNTAEERKVIRYYSIDETGDDLRELDIREHVAIDPVWLSGELYYVGSSSDGEYPRPLNRANADFSRHIKVMDIPGPLVCVEGSRIYCLSQDRRSILRMPSTVVKTFDASIEKVIPILTQDEFVLTDANGKQNRWSTATTSD